MTSIPMTEYAPAPQSQHPVAVQILGMILFAGFAIPVTIVALTIFWPAGFALAVVLGWRGTFAFGGNTTNAADIKDLLLQIKHDDAPRPSGNSSFDRYRADMMQRLEMEQENFDTFLDRLRAAKDKAEFDQFMDDRARSGSAQETEH